MGRAVREADSANDLHIKKAEMELFYSSSRHGVLLKYCRQTRAYTRRQTKGEIRRVAISWQSSINWGSMERARSGREVKLTSRDQGKCIEGS